MRLSKKCVVKMKKIRKPKILPVECKICHGEYQPKWRNIKKFGLIKGYSICPWCKHENVVQFEKPEVVAEMEGKA